MRLPGIEWDEAKNEINKREHNGLDFEVAQYVFQTRSVLNGLTGAKITPPGKNAGKR
jgi:uncharacterized DUF497 family protein